MPPVGPPGGGDRDLPPGGARAEKRYLRRARHGAAGRTRTGRRVRESQDPARTARLTGGGPQGRICRPSPSSLQIGTPAGPGSLAAGALYPSRQGLGRRPGRRANRQRLGLGSILRAFCRSRVTGPDHRPGLVPADSDTLSESSGRLRGQPSPESGRPGPGFPSAPRATAARTIRLRPGSQRPGAARWLPVTRTAHPTQIGCDSASLSQSSPVRRGQPSPRLGSRHTPREGRLARASAGRARSRPGRAQSAGPSVP